MATVLAMSSQVVRGSVGNSACVFALQRLGHEVWPLPTVLFSNHPGHHRFTGQAIPSAQLEELWVGLRDNGWLAQIDAVLTGYLAVAETAAFAARLVAAYRQIRPDGVFLCDPAIGDEPAGLYVPEVAAEIIRDELLPLADVATPNRFELAWLSDTALAGDAAAAREAAQTLNVPVVIATSIPAADDRRVANVLVSVDELLSTPTDRLREAPHGTGDFFAALHLGASLNGFLMHEALEFATNGVRIVLEASQGRDELALVQTQDLWAASTARA